MIFSSIETKLVHRAKNIVDYSIGIVIQCIKEKDIINVAITITIHANMTVNIHKKMHLMYI